MFMQPHIVYDRWIVIETTYGTTVIPQSVIGKQTCFSRKELQPYCDGDVISSELVDGYGARLSAPGYLDCTDWTVFPTLQDAEQYLKDTFFDE